VRAASSADIVAGIFGWVVKMLPKQTPGNRLAQAIGYLAGIWPGLLVFLSNPAVPLDNNASERSMRGRVVGRKNHHGSRSKRGTEVAALLYTILESCKLAGVNPAAYLREAVLAGIREKPIALPHEWVPLATPPAP
jgi:transposase